VRVFLHEYSEPFSRLVALWLDLHPGLELVGVEHHRDTALMRIAELQPDVVVIDAMLHSRAPLAPEDVRRAAPAAAIIVYTGHSAHVARRIAPSADGYVHKRGDSHELIHALTECDGTTKPGASTAGAQSSQGWSGPRVDAARRRWSGAAPSLTIGESGRDFHSEMSA
jgi:DNA-binding NarL/FixJ family response regulator